MISINAIVRGAVAHHASRSVDAIRAWHRLDADLRLTPLALVLVVLEVEGIVEVEVPVEQMADVETVGDSFAFLSSVVAAAHRAQAFDRVA